MSKTTHFILTSLVVLLLGSVAHANGWQAPVAMAQVAPITTITTTSQPDFYQVSSADVASAVTDAIRQQTQKDNLTATVNAGTPAVLHSANHPIRVAIHALQVNADAKLWQAQAYILNAQGTETVKPIAGRFDTTLQVPVLIRQLRAGDVIAANDLEMRTLPERQLRKDTVTDMSTLIGQSPRRIVSPGRPLRIAEISAPTVIKKGQMVEMRYTTPYMSIRATGEALEDGAQGSMIRLKNTKSQKAVSGRVASNGLVELNSEATL